MIVEIRFNGRRDHDTYYLDCREDIAKGIKELQLEFDIWCSNLSEDHPIMQYFEKNSMVK